MVKKYFLILLSLFVVNTFPVFAVAKVMRDPFLDVSYQLDTSRQIQIEARIVNADDSFTHELGLQYGTVKDSDDGDHQGLSMDLPLADNNVGHFDVALAKLNGGMLLDMELAALESEGRGKIISRPKLVTIDREPAYIEAGDEVPYQEKTAEGNTSITFKKAVLSLKVTPIIMSSNKILLRIVVNQDKISQLLFNGEPAISTHVINTQVIVANKQTVVLGGIYEVSNDSLVRKVPILSRIPLLGELFTYRRNIAEKKELLIFITPTII